MTGPAGEHVADLRSAASRTHFIDADFLDAEEISVPNVRLRFRFQDVESGRSVLDKEIVALMIAELSPFQWGKSCKRVIGLHRQPAPT